MEPSNKLTIDTLDKNWRDKDYVLLHASFQLLKDCVEKESLLTGNTNWNADEKHRQAKAEIEALYQWWLERIRQDDQLGLTEEDYAKDTEMLHRLIGIRWALWT